MATELNLLKRLQGQTPLFFKRIRTYAISLAATATALLAASETISNFTLPELVIKVCQYAIVAGVVASGVSSTAVTNNSPEPEKQK